MTAKKALVSSYFPEFLEEDLLYINTALFIEEILEDSCKVISIIRPRRFGITLNRSMLQHVLAAQVQGSTTRGFFARLQTLGENLQKIKSKIFYTIRKLFEEIRGMTANAALDALALLTLSGCLLRLYRENVYILINACATPLNYACSTSWFQNEENCNAVAFITGFLNPGLKNNPYLVKGVLTGIVNINKTNIYSWLHNIKKCSVLDAKYPSYFGFPEQEVAALAQASYLDLATIQEWCHGYKIHGVTIYNPWSTMNYIAEPKVADYWIATTSKHLLQNAIVQLLQEQLVKVSLDRTFDNLATTTKAFFSMFLHKSYVTCQRLSDTYIAAKRELRISKKAVISFCKNILHIATSENQAPNFSRRLGSCAIPK